MQKIKLNQFIMLIALQCYFLSHLTCSEQKEFAIQTACKNIINNSSNDTSNALDIIKNLGGMRLAKLAFAMYCAQKYIVDFKIDQTKKGTPKSKKRNRCF